MKKFRYLVLAAAVLAALFVLATAAFARTPERFIPAEPQTREVYTGSCGADANWSLDTSTHVLTITGTGAISSKPWTNYIDSIYTLEIGDGITNINNSIFANHTMLSTVNFGNTIETIGIAAFKNCERIERIELPDSLRFIYGSGSGWDPDWLPNGAFYSCDSLEYVSIGNGLESIGRATFRECINLKTLIISDGATGSIGERAFDGCTSLRVVNMGNGITGIDDYAFVNCNRLQNIVIGDSVVYIGNHAFQNCSAMTSVQLGAHTNAINQYAFSGCSSINAIVFNNELETINIGAFKNCDSLVTVDIPDCVKHIYGNGSGYDPDWLPNGAFYSCDNLETVTIGNGIEGIGRAAFRECPNLKTVIIADGATGSIGDRAFDSCTSLVNLSMGNGITGIDTYVFNNCNQLRTVIIGDAVTYIGNYAFLNCSSVTSATMGTHLETIGGFAFCGCTSLSELNFNDGLITIGIGSFKNCDSLITVDIPNTVKNIYGSGSGYDPDWLPNGAFYSCDNLESVTIGSGLEGLGRATFRDCSKLKTVIIMDGAIGNIGERAFDNCVSLRYVSIGNNISAIDNLAFNNCPALNKLIIGRRVQTIGSNAFGGCTSLTNVYFLGDAPNSITAGGASGQSFNSSLVVLRYLPDNYDWTTPTWNGYNTAPFDVSELPVPVTLGDADGNGVVNANDALMVLRYALGIIDYVDTAAADVDGNGVINANDALMILRAALGLISL